MPLSSARRWYALAAVALGLFVIYGSLIPFEWRPIPLAQAWRQFSDTVTRVPPGRLSRTDVVANILLFVPFGIAVSGSLLAEADARRSKPLASAAALATGLAVSVLAEFLQTFTHGSVPAPVDIAAQTIGGSIGIALWALFGDALTRWCRATLTGSAGDRRRRVLMAIVAGWVLVSLAPFDLTVDLGDLSRRVRLGRIVLVPFTDAYASVSRRTWDMLAECLGGIPVGMLMATAPFREHAVRAGVAFARGAALVALVEVAQLFVRSHTASTTDVVLASAGAAIGVLTSRRFSFGAGQPAASRGRAAARAMVALTAWYIVLAFYHWQPFDFVASRAVVRQKLAHVSLLPFASYAAGSPLNALDDFGTKLALAIPLGIIAAFATHVPRATDRVLVGAWILLAVAVFASLELGQLFLPTRVPDLTDVMTGTVGTLIGGTVATWVRTGRHVAG